MIIFNSLENQNLFLKVYSYVGRSYAVFGHPGGSSEVVALSSLNESTVLKFDGENTGDWSGAVSAAGDINGDSYADFFIGAQGYPEGHFKGRSYVVFGGPRVGSSGFVALSNLNGANGFKLDGENDTDYSGWSVSTAGDIDGDGYADLLIGAHGSGNRTGRSYVVFGGPEVGSSGVIALSSLNGPNGFRLDGENIGDDSGCSVSTVGDINGDGYPDLIVGAQYYGNNIGRSYVVFGSPRVGSSGVVALSNLDGSDGFKIDGENNGDYSGFTVGMAGDINGDGHDDVLIGAPGCGNGTGCSYVIFGGPKVGSSGVIAL